MCGLKARIITHKSGLYLSGIVGLDKWASFAIALKRYADLKPMTSSEDPIPDYIHLMLMGYALEDLAKCIIAHKSYTPSITDITPFEEKFNKLEFSRRDGQIRNLKTHSLDDLYKANDLGFEVNDAEIIHLKFISMYTTWKGRYPIPSEIEHIPSLSEPSFEELSTTARNIYAKAIAEVERLRSLRS